MAGFNVVKLVTNTGHHIKGNFRKPGFVMAEARMAEGITAEDVLKAMKRGHLTVEMAPCIEEESEQSQQEQQHRRRARAN